MKRYIVPGVRTPFVKAGAEFVSLNSIELSIPVMQAMANRSLPDFVAWGQVIPSANVSNIAREAWLEAKLDPTVPGVSSVLACSTSMMAVIQASGMLGFGGSHLALVGGAESMSHVPIALKPEVAQQVAGLAMKDPQAALVMVNDLNAGHFNLPIKGWANRLSGRSMGEHTEDTAKFFDIARVDQDKIAFESHQNAIAAQNAGFFDDLIIPLGDISQDTIPRADSTLEKLNSLSPVFDRSESGTLTAGNSSPLTDGAAAIWVADETGLERLGIEQQNAIEIVDWRLGAMDYQEEGILMAPARAIPQLLSAHGLTLDDIAVWEIHEAFAAQVLANIQGITDSSYLRDKAGVTSDLGAFPIDRLNQTGGSLAIGHPFGATGARVLSQAAKQLLERTSGSYAVVSVCADGGQGSVMLLRKPE
ncbi:acetyl-CoA C-acyltransferase [uncultured Tateyamaria sp.]|uniref:thiolase family protein n=1 Tax=uncultured Tateyamaria sp. TaxID=455651 RepID=UPI0026201B77|nr:acetyl-CoA C-acyltransferase [uncultured Tateyamaria sp.]